MAMERSLAPRERAVLELLVEACLAPGARQLVDQIPFVRVVGGLPTLLDLEVSGSMEAADLEGGPLPVRAIVGSRRGEPEGEILIWLASGYLSGLEYAWLTDEMPAEFPPVDRVRVLQP